MDTRLPIGYRALRVGRWSETGRIYLVTTVTWQRQPLFEDWRCAWAAASCLGRPDTWAGAQLLCWVLMPDHWHELVMLDCGAALSTVMREAKGRAARAANHARGRGGAVWMEGFHDRALRDARQLLPAARYIVANPLRAGLVRRVGDYPYWDAVWLCSPAIAPCEASSSGAYAAA
ncbi:transposase [Xanthomonas sp. CFBP 8445]|uniref:REP-associated tyrosine transposase n=1 Tax=Xanthomonas sp. CFBP 8445 TaxID=2971236 RepID=UPI0002EE2FBF|nr:transposase [Xanthomonas sp. CFBP 8445]UYC12070.1 transposase [Xanthomonas sp. CFBP 8445]